MSLLSVPGMVFERCLGIQMDHSVIFLSEMQTKFYCKNIGTIVIFDKKMFKFLCHMIGSNHY